MRIGIDLGGTKIEAVALDDDGCEVDRERIATPANDYDATIAAVRDLVMRIEARMAAHTKTSAVRTASVGIGMPGSLSPTTGLVRNANSTWLNGRRFDADLQAALRRPIRIANDADCFALSEATDGAGMGQRVVFGVILGTGVGGGIVVDGKLWTGRNAIAGEWGHNSLPHVEPIDRPLPPCYCGRAGCIETYLSGPALLDDHRSRGHHAATTREIVERAHRDEPAARETMARYARRLAKSLASVINLLDPDVIVLGGGLSNIDALYAAVPPLLGEFVFSDTVTTPIVKNRHGDSSGVRGAAWLWPAG